MFITSVSTCSVLAEIVHVQYDRPEAANLMLRGHRAVLPGRGRTHSAIIDQHQPLAFAILERQCQPAIDFGYVAGMGRRLCAGDRCQ